MPKYVAPALYEENKQKVLEMSLAVQAWESGQAVRGSSGLSDREIAEKLGLEPADVTEIRCIAEIDLLPQTTWMRSAEWKQNKAGRKQP
ncbi:hypothetical protein ACFLYV_02690 [Chloroflexota bacterium]